MDRTLIDRSPSNPRNADHRRPNLFLLVVFLLLAAGITLAGYFYYRKIVETERSETGHSLTAIANLKVAQIEAWRQERLGDARMIAENPLLRDELEAILQDRLAPARRGEAVQWMRSLIRAYHYKAVMLFDSRLNRILLEPQHPILSESTDWEIARRTMREGRIILSDLYRVEPSGSIHMDLAIPIPAAPENHGIIGTLVIRIDPRNFLYPLIQTWPEPSASAESLLIRREGESVLFLNDLRHRRDSALRLRLPLSRSGLPAAEAVLGRSGVIEGVDYRGVPVMAALRPVPNTSWFLISKVDSEEVFAPLRERTFLVWALAIALVIACGAGLGIVNGRQAAAIHRRQEEEMAEYRRQLEQTISETTILFRKVLETLPVGLYLADREGRIISSNPAGHRIWADTKLVGLDRYSEYKAWRIDTGERLSDETWALARAIRRGETSLDEVLEIESFDGTRKIILNSAVPVYDDQRAMLGAFVVIQDITERFRMQRQMEATNALLNLFVHTASRAEYLRRSLELVERWAGVECAGFRVFDPAGQAQEEPFRGFDPEFWRRSSPHVGRAECCACLKALLDRAGDSNSLGMTPGGSIWIDNLDSESGRAFLAGQSGTPCPCLEYGYRGLAIVPIRTPERVAGTLHLASREAGKPTAQSVQLVESLSPILAEAVQRFEIGEELQQHRDKLEELVRLRTRELEAANDQLRREIVERKRMETELLEMERLRILADSRKEWQETFDAITDLVSIHDTDFVVRKANRAFLDHFGLAPEEVARRRCFELFHEGSCPVDGCPQCAPATAAGPASREVADPKTGRVFLVSTYPFHRADGQPGGIIHIARDVTEQKDREMKLILSERLASLGQMAAGIAHEINNPLATIGTCAEGLLRRLREGREDPALLKDYLVIIEEEVRRCQAITNGMLSFVRHDGGDRMPLDVRQLIDKTLALVGFQGRLRNVKVVLDLGSEPLRVRANEGGLRQVLLALVVNALDAMEDSGTLTLFAATVDGRVTLRVRDTGPGIPTPLLHRIFDLFFTTKSARGGTGLGLPIAHKIARENGGDLTVSSAPGSGATFTVTLPAI